MARQEMVKREQGDGKLQTLKGLLDQQVSKFAEVAPKYMNVERLIRLMLAAYSRNPKIAQCSPASVLLFTMRCAETGLEPIGAGGAWPVPYENRKNGTTELQFIPDYRGLIALAKINRDVKEVPYYPVYENDDFLIELGMSPNVIHIPMVRGERGKLIGVYAIVITPDDIKIPTWMAMEDVEHIKGKSKAAAFGPWKTDYTAMALKSVVRRALKPFARSPQLQAALEYDNETFKDVVVDRPSIEEAPTPKTIHATPEPKPEKAQPSAQAGPTVPTEREPGEDDDQGEEREPDFKLESPAPQPKPSEEDIRLEKELVEKEIKRLADELKYDEGMVEDLRAIHGDALMAYLQRKLNAKKNRK